MIKDMVIDKEYIEEPELLTIEEIKRMHDKAYQHNKITRERAADDLVFYWVTNWDETTLGESSLGYKGEFNVTRKAGRQIIGDLRSNPVQVDFIPEDDDDMSGADLIDGTYRTLNNENTSIEAFDNAKSESVVCGIGGWEIYSEEVTTRMGEKHQELFRRPLHEFNSTAFPDPNAKLLDKSDGDYWSILIPYSEEGMEDLAEELTGEEESLDLTTFKDPEHSYTFPWVSGKDEVFYAGRFYHKTKVKDAVVTLTDPDGKETIALESSLSKMMGELTDDGYEITNRIETTRDSVRLYIVNGARILSHYEIAGPNIPVIPNYGERAIVEGEEHWEGCTRLAKDPQRLRNFQMSYLADIVSRTPRPQPIFLPEQIQGHEGMYQQAGADSYLPYLLQNRTDANGKELPIGPVGQMPEQPVSSALMQSIALSREAVTDVAPANVPQDIEDIDLSGKALGNLQNRLDEQSVVYQQNFKHAIRYDAQVYQGMLTVIKDTCHKVMCTKMDGTRTTKTMMDNVIDKETGELVVSNDITNKSFKVFATIGPDYKSVKEQTDERLDNLIEKAAMFNPQMADMLFLKRVSTMDGNDFDDIREYARNQSLIKGYIKPDEDDEEEMKLVQESQQQQEPDANTLMAQAEQAKADASMADVQRKAELDRFNAQSTQLKTQVSQFDAETRRLAVQVDAKEANANMEFKRIDSLTKRMDAINKGKAGGGTYKYNPATQELSNA